MPENRRVFRNPVAQNPLLRKGGPHQKSRSAERRNQRQAIDAALDTWHEELERQNEESASEGADSSLYSLLPPFPSSSQSRYTHNIYT